MAGRYSFIDVCVIEEVRGHFARGEPMIILTPDLGKVLWVNGPGVRFLDHPDVASAMGAPAQLDAVAQRQIMALPGFPTIGRGRTLLLRTGAGFANRALACRASQVRMPDDSPGILLVLPQQDDPTASEEDVYARAIANIGNGSNYAALLGENGEILAESGGLGRLGISHKAIGRLIREVRYEPNRLIKRLIPTHAGEVAAGVGRLSELPPLHLLVLVADMPESGVETAEAEKEEAEKTRLNSDREIPTETPLAPYRKEEPVEPEAAAQPPLRFSWRTDRDGRLVSISEEFACIAVPGPDLLMHRSLAELAENTGIDPEGEIAGLLERRETWSGRTLYWPLAGTNRMVPVDLAALPAYDRNREFDGFRGFGIARLAEAVPDPAARGLERPAPAPASESTPDITKPPAGEERRKRSRHMLSDSERSAFQEIAARLRKEAAPEPGRETDRDRAAAAPTGEDSAITENGSYPAAGKVEDDLGLGRGLQLLNQIPMAIVIRSPDNTDHPNAEFFRLTGYETAEAFARSGGFDALFAEPQVTQPGPKPIQIRTRDGGEIPCEALLKSIRWGDGKALMLALRPATADAELQKLRQRIEELTAILDTATDGVVLIRSDRTIRSINHSAEALFGRSETELADKPFTSLFARESQSLAADYLASLGGGGVASIFNDGREVIGKEAQGGFIPLFMTIGKLPGGGGYCAVLRDLTAWKRAEEELVQARGLAEQASSQKSGFLARISHEIRTPLNAIIGFSELMMEERFGPINNERYRDYLRDINRSGNHVLELVNDLLDISKIEAGEQEMSFEAISLNDCLADAVAMMQPEANRERVIIRSSLASGLPDVIADRRSIRQIALNLLSNAIRYTPAGGQVILSTLLEPSGELIIRVRDTGVGMSRAEIEHALKPFKQVARMQKLRAGGTGLGLPLTKAMVEANRAGFRIESEPEAGTMVEITFPPARVLAG